MIILERNPTTNIRMAESNPIQEELPNTNSQAGNDDLLKLPSSLLEASKLRRIRYDHPAMRLVETSFEVRRACNQAIIFAYGVSGSGASKTLNHLFNSELIPTSDSKSETTTVTEYVTTLTSEHWRATNLEIGFINPPGYNDTKGEMQDVMNLSAIEEFIKGHDHLGLHSYKCYPNIVLITISATDIRISGHDSNFNKMLKALKHLNLVDNRKNNVLIVLTHAMGVPKNSFATSIREQAESVKKIVSSSLDIPNVETVYVENCTDSYQLETEGDWTLLPDGTQQPLNLFEAMIQLMKNNGDEVGIEAVRLFFQGDAKLPQKRRIEPIGKENEEGYQRWCKVVIQKNIHIQDNECIRALKLYLQTNPNIPEDGLLLLMAELNKARITHPSELTGQSWSEVQKRVWPYQLTELDKEALIQVFKVKPLSYPRFLDEISRGCINKEIIPTAPQPIFNFVTDQPDDTRVCNGVLLPTCMDILFYENSVVNCYCETLSRQKEQDGEVQIIDTIKSEITITNQIKPYTFIFSITHTAFSLPIQYLEQIENYITPEFKQSVYALPDSCMLPEVREEGTEQIFHPQYLEFLDKYGHCFRTHWEGGGVITGQITIEMSEVEIHNTEATIKQYLRLFARMRHQIKEPIQNEKVNSVIQAVLNAELTWRGGIPPVHKGRKLKVVDVSSGIWESWKRSLIEDPIPLENIKLSPVSFPVYSLIKPFQDAKANQLKLVVDGTADEDFDIDDILSLNEEDFILQMGNPIEINSDVETEHETRSRRDSRVFAFADILNEYEVIEVPERVHDTRRTGAARRARTNTALISAYGFPANSMVKRKFQSDDIQSEEIKMKDLQKGNYVECISARHTRAYVPVVDISKLKGAFYYIQIRHSHGVFSSGDLNNVLKGKKLKKTIVRKLKIRDKLVWINTAGTKLKTTRITELRLEKMEGNIQPCIYEDDHFSVIVDGIACGGREETCFPGNASVTLKGGEKVRMDEVKIGDYVLSIHPSTGKPVYSKVYLWAHRDPHVTATFLHITHPHGHLHISANHLILSGEQRIPVPAGHLAVGDTIHSLLSPAATATATAISVPVLHIHTCTQVGYYAPFTNNGLIVVGGIASSVYSQPSTRSHAHVCASVTGGLVEQFGLHRVGECVMTPVRVGCKLGVGSIILTKQMDTTTHIHKYCQWLMKLYHNLN